MRACDKGLTTTVTYMRDSKLHLRLRRVMNLLSNVVSYFFLIPTNKIGCLVVATGYCVPTKRIWLWWLTIAVIKSHCYLTLFWAMHREDFDLGYHREDMHWEDFDAWHARRGFRFAQSTRGPSNRLMWSDQNEGEDEDLGMDVYGEPMAILSPTSSQQEEEGNEKTETRLSLPRTLKPICSCHLPLKDVRPNFLIKAR